MASSRTIATHFSPIIIEGALVLPPGTCGMIEASAARWAAVLRLKVSAAVPAKETNQA